MKPHKNVIIRPMPDGYAKDCWIVTGAIYSSEVRYYRKYERALAYANKKAKELEEFNCHITVEERLFDHSCRHKIIED